MIRTTLNMPHCILAQLNAVRRAWGHSVPSIVRKCVNAASRHGVDLSAYHIETNRRNSMPVQVTFWADKPASNEVVAAVNWYMQQHKEALSNWQPPSITVEHVPYKIVEAE